MPSARSKVYFNILWVAHGSRDESAVRSTRKFMAILNELDTKIRHDVVFLSHAHPSLEDLLRSPPWPLTRPLCVAPLLLLPSHHLYYDVPRIAQAVAERRNGSMPVLLPPLIDHKALRRWCYNQTDAAWHRLRKRCSSLFGYRHCVVGRGGHAPGLDDFLVNFYTEETELPIQRTLTVHLLTDNNWKESLEDALVEPAIVQLHLLLEGVLSRHVQAFLDELTSEGKVSVPWECIPSVVEPGQEEAFCRAVLLPYIHGYVSPS